MQLDIDYIKGLIQVVLDNEHKSKIKREIKVSSDKERINFACPLCGDSEKVASKKRGNLYTKSLRYVCFNCGERHTLFSFLKTHHIEIDPEKRIALADYVSENISRTRWNEDEFICNNLDKLLSIEELSSYFNTHEDSPITDFRPITKGSKVYHYLVDRKIVNHEDLYEATYWHNSKWSELVLVNVNQAKGKVIGIQTRNLKARNQRFYKIYPFSTLYQMVKGEELDEIEKVGYDKLSSLYNILKVDWSRPITIFEGFLDTKFFPNAIGCVGTNTDVGFVLNQGVDVKLFYDYDRAGIKKSKEMIKNGQRVFLWERLFEQWSAKSKNPYSAYYKLTSHIVDLNDVAKVVSNPYVKLELEKYFSIDELDMIWIRDIKNKNIA